MPLTTISSPDPTQSHNLKRRHRADSNPDAQWSVSSSAPDPKRSRPADHAASAAATSAAAMSAKVQGKRPEVIDLTSSSNTMTTTTTTTTTLASRPQPLAAMAASTLRPAGGTRKLFIKNLRPATPTRAADLDEYYARTKADLDAALTDIFAGRTTSKPMEGLYRGVEVICRKGEAASLVKHLDERCRAHLKEVLTRVWADCGVSDEVTVLRAVLDRWQKWSVQLKFVRWMYTYLDRSHLLGGRNGPMVNDMGIDCFREAMFGRKIDRKGGGILPPGGVGSGEAGSGGGGPGDKVLAAVCTLIDLDRRKDVRFERALLRDSVAMLRLFNAYLVALEPMILRASHQYFEEFAEERNSTMGLKDYINACKELLELESERCDAYNFDSTTKRQLKDFAHNILIDKYAAKLLDTGSVARLLEANDVGSMKALYELLKLKGMQKRLKDPWEKYIREAGAAIVSDITRGDEMVVRLLELRRSLDIMIRDAFARDEDFTYGLREAFGHFINDKNISAAWNTGTSKVGEMIAKYIDMLLRGGLKTLPKTLLSDNKDKAEAERSGMASTGDEDAELDRQLDQGLELFRFIQGKDVFEAFYKKDLARRLLMGRSASRDAERNMLTKLKSECGSSFTHNLEQMFKDQELARDEMASYKEWVAATGRANSSLDLNVSILSAAAWPTYPDTQVLLPKEVLEHITTFDKYYKSKHTGRRLTWKHSLGHCVVKARFDRGAKELLVSAYQAVVLVLFNEVETSGEGGKPGTLSYAQIAQATGMPDAELERTLQSLACGKVRVLTKQPKGRDVAKTDVFSVNRAFADPKFRVKINQIQLRETKEENKETHERVAADRQFETQAAIVRIMKSRKSMTHPQLVAEVINQTKSRGAVDAADIKLNIEK